MPVLWIIDDNIPLLNSLELAFYNDFEVATFSRPLECLLAFTKGKLAQPDVILTDFDMPGMNGLDMLEKIMPSSPHMRIYLITSALNDEVISRAMQLGVKGWMAKPFDLLELRRMLISQE